MFATRCSGTCPLSNCFRSEACLQHVGNRQNMEGGQCVCVCLYIVARDAGRTWPVGEDNVDSSGVIEWLSW